MLVNESLDVRRQRVVLLDEIGKLVDSDDDVLGLDFLPEVGEGLVPPIDARNPIPEVVSNSFDELLSLPFFGFLCCQK